MAAAISRESQLETGELSPSGGERLLGLSEMIQRLSLGPVLIEPHNAIVKLIAGHS
jgi:hypothetical protein